MGFSQKLSSNDLQYIPKGRIEWFPDLNAVRKFAVRRHGVQFAASKPWGKTPRGWLKSKSLKHDRKKPRKRNVFFLVLAVKQQRCWENAPVELLGTWCIWTTLHTFATLNVDYVYIINTRWWFHMLLIFTPTWGNEPIWRASVSNGLVQPPTPPKPPKFLGHLFS